MAFKWFAVSGKKKEFEFRCSDCGELHKGSPSFPHDYPCLVYSIPEEERESRLYLTDDLCVVDEKHYFIRVILEIPIIDTEKPFTWGVWVSQSEDNFMTYQETFGTDQSAVITFGWLTINLPYYLTRDSKGFIENLKCDVHWAIKGQRPHIIIHEIEHELFTDQNQYISWDKAIKIAQLAMHPKAD